MVAAFVPSDFWNAVNLFPLFINKDCPTPILVDVLGEQALLIESHMPAVMLVVVV